MWEDPIVKEVRQHRLAIEAKAGNDWETIMARAVEAQQRFAARLIPAPTGSALLSAIDGIEKIEAKEVIANAVAEAKGKLEVA